MRLDIPDVPSTLERISSIKSTFMGKSQTISEWVKEHRKYIRHNLGLVNRESEGNDIEILLSFLRDLLVRAMPGEAGESTYRELQTAIKSKSDLRKPVYRKALKKSKYRWGVEDGSSIISEVVSYFGNELQWDWNKYLKQAKKHKESNFSDDHLLTLKGIGFKVRDLALSSFDPYYAAFDLHVARVPTRIGFLNYGYELLGDTNIEMGNNPGNVKNYLFLHKLFLKLSDLTDGEFLPADLDRTFWHFGRTYCGATPKCELCPINKMCLTGKIIVN